MTDLPTRIRELLAQATHRHIVRRVTADAVLLAELLTTTAHLPADAETLERIHVVLHGERGRDCASGNRRPFNKLGGGWRYCARQCQCQRDEHAERMRGIHASRDADRASAIREKARSTAVERGHADLASAARRRFAEKRAAGLVDESLLSEKRRVTMMERHGAASPLSLPVFAARKTATMIERHGVAHAMQSPILMERANSTHAQRHGGSDRMARARQAFATANDGLNPSQVPEIAARRVETMIHRHGVSNAGQSPELRAKAVRTWRTRLGADSPLSAASIRARIFATNLSRYGDAHPVRAHIAREHLAVLDDATAMRAALEQKSVHELAREFGVSPYTVYLRCQKHEIERPKSSYETAIRAFLRGHDLAHRANDRRVIAPQELDMVIPDVRVAVEFGGLFWHSERFKDRLYHQTKMLRAKEAGYHLVTIFEDEWLLRPDVVTSRLRAILGVAARGPGARQTEVVPLTGGDAARFLAAHHMQGAGPHGFARYGAIHNGALVAVMTFSRPRPAMGRRDGAPEMLRFAGDGRILPGIASKLFSAFVREHAPTEIVSYADARWSSGGLYTTLGFTPEGITQPNYAYWRANTVERVARFRFRKDRLVAAGYAQSRSEAEIMRDAGWLRIYDCGSWRYRWTP